MNRNNKSLFTKVTALLLALIMVCPIGASAVEPRASYYLESYNAYPYSAGWGKVQIWFTVTGVDYMDDLGALTIQIYESTDNVNFTWVKSYTNDTTSSMLSSGYSYMSHVEYQGVVGRYYKAYVCIYAGKDGAGDTRYFWTGSKKATLLAE